MAMKSPFLTAVLLVLATLFAAVVPHDAAAMDKAALVAAIQKKYGAVESIKAGFTQTTKSELFGDETLSGTLLMKRPAKMRWSFGKDKIFVSDGTKLWIYTSEDKQVIEYDDISGNRDSAQSFLTSLDKIEEHYAINVLASNDTSHVIELSPKGDDQFKKVKLSLDGALMLQQVVITDAFDNVTEIGFKNVEFNVSIPDSEFVFTAPSGTDVIKAN